MKFIKNLFFDIYNGIIKHYLLFLSPLVIAGVISMSCINRSRMCVASGNIASKKYSFGDIWFYIYGGMEKFVPKPGLIFKFPAIWIMVFAISALLVFSYPVKDMLGVGAHYLVCGGSRARWWFSKAIWNITATAIYHIIILFTILTCCAITKVSFDNGLNIGLLEFLYQFETEMNLYFRTSIPIAIFILPIFISIAMNLFQMTLTLFINPTYSFLINGIIMIASAYLVSPFMIYNYAMPLRYSWIYAEGFKYQYGYIVALAVAVISVMIGFIRFSRYDIIKKEDN